MAFLSLSKLDAAQRQLHTAIRLYFDDGDPVAIHTLVSAAHAVLDDVASHRGDGPTLKRDLLANVRPEFRKDFLRRLHRARNFFKHADADPDEVLEFDPDAETWFWLVDAALTYHRLSGTRPLLTRAFLAWGSMTWAKDALTYPDETPELRESMQRWAATMTKQEFLQSMIALAYEHGESVQ